MTNQKNRFFTFCVSLVPGAGEMYMGLYARGVSTMLLFFGVFGIASLIHMEELAVILPVIWCYSFFYTHNLRGMNLEKFQTVEDKSILPFALDKSKGMLKIHYKTIGVLAIVIGLFMIWNIGIDWIRYFASDYFSDWVWRVGYTVPRFAMGLLVIFVGYRMAKAEQNSDDAQEEDEVFFDDEIVDSMN